MNPKVLFGGIIAIILLSLYAYSVIFAIGIVLNDRPATQFTSGFSLVISTVGGLVSALIISELAISTPLSTPATRLLSDNAAPTTVEIFKWVTWAYLFVWIALGVASFVIGVMKFPDALPELTTLGKAWLGLATAAGYSYFALKQE